MLYETLVMVDFYATTPSGSAFTMFLISVVIDEKIRVSTNGDQKIIGIIYKLQPDMETLLNIDELLAYLMKHRVLTNNEEQHLGPGSYATPLEKVRFLLSESVLGRKGLKGQKNFIRALYESSKRQGNTGHRDLVTRLRENGVIIIEKYTCTAI